MNAESLPRPRRGRPPGPGIDDEPTLARAADLMVQAPSMTPSTAFKRVMKGIGPSHLRLLLAVPTRG